MRLASTLVVLPNLIVMWPSHGPAERDTLEQLLCAELTVVVVALQLLDVIQSQCLSRSADPVSTISVSSGGPALSHCTTL